MKHYIKNMVCNRCIAAVRATFEKEGVAVQDVKLGEAETAGPLPEAQEENIRKELLALGFELMDDKRAKLIEKVKTAIIELIHHSDAELKTNLSDFIAEKTGRDYNTVSAVFSEVEGLTIEKYAILQRIEKVKELLVYGELTTSEIAYRMGYSSVAHLSGQFKKITGLTPGHYRKVRDQKRRPLDEIS